VSKLQAYCGAFVAYVLMTMPEASVTFARREYANVREIEARVRLGERIVTHVTALWVLDMHALEADVIGEQDAFAAVRTLKES
jgi:hypothetical protein